MRILFLILALSTVLPAEAAFYRRSSTHQHHHHVPWKSIAAGGAAAGTVIAAYKVSNGVEEGLRTVAKEKPEVFHKTVDNLFSPLRWLVGVILLVLGYSVYRRLNPQKKEEKNAESIQK